MKKPVSKNRPASALTPQERAALPVLAYLAANHEAVWHAARLLGGYEQCRLVDRIVHILQNDRRLTRRVRVMLDQLMDLLTLEPAVEDRCLAFGAFAPIHPADPAVVEICLVTDRLRDALDEADALLRVVVPPCSTQQAA